MSWINVKDRFPDKYDFVLVWDNLMGTNTASGVDISTAAYQGNGEWEDYMGQPHSYSDHIQYWMPLPEPPKQ